MLWKLAKGKVRHTLDQQTSQMSNLRQSQQKLVSLKIALAAEQEKGTIKRDILTKYSRSLVDGKVLCRFCYIGD